MLPRTPRQQFGVRFAINARRWRGRIHEGLALAGMSDATWLPLIHLDAIEGDCTQKYLAEQIGIDGSSLVRLLDILTRKGLVERRPDPLDARARRVCLTQAGSDFLIELRGILWAEEQEMLADVSDADLEVVMRVFGQIETRMTGAAKRPDGNDKR